MAAAIPPPRSQSLTPYSPVPFKPVLGKCIDIGGKLYLPGWFPRGDICAKFDEKKDEEGTLFYPEASFYFGHFKEGLPCGAGYFHLGGQRTYSVKVEGIFEAGKYKVENFNWDDGTICNGTFVNGGIQGRCSHHMLYSPITGSVEDGTTELKGFTVLSDWSQLVGEGSAIFTSRTGKRIRLEGFFSEECQEEKFCYVRRFFQEVSGKVISPEYTFEGKFRWDLPLRGTYKTEKPAPPYGYFQWALIEGIITYNPGFLNPLNDYPLGTTFTGSFTDNLDKLRFLLGETKSLFREPSRPQGEGIITLPGGKKIKVLFEGGKIKELGEEKTEERANKENEARQKKVEELSKQQSVFASAKRQQEQELANLKQQVTQLSDKLEKKEAEKVTLNARIERLTAELSQKEATEENAHQLADLRQKEKRLGLEIERLTKELEGANATIETLQSKQAEWEKQKEVAMREEERLRGQLEQRTHQHAQAQREIEELKQKLVAPQPSGDNTLQARLEELQKAEAEARGQIAKLNEELKVARAAQAKADAVKELSAKLEKPQAPSTPKRPPVEARRIPVAQRQGETIALPDGSSYTGSVKEGKPDGEGVQTFVSHPEFRKFKGEFEEGAFRKGTITYLDGATYVGEVVNNKPHGKGTLNTIEGETLEGTFENGEFKG